MKLITTRTGTFLTGSEIADAVMQNALLLCRNRRTAAVEIPVVTAEGNIERAAILLGATTEISARTVPFAATELTDQPTLVELNAQAALIGVIRALPFRHDEHEPLSYLDPWDD
ncbi:hypothetical protein ACIRCZ_15585 [Leifsonia sp. NPDC102414]|uniref:hypothetical protein n=1 Tax=Leifsonia sp. NPDC102414 TaxID=3364124 RepID=UPI003822C00E